MAISLFAYQIWLFLCALFRYVRPEGCSCIDWYVGEVNTQAVQLKLATFFITSRSVFLKGNSRFVYVTTRISWSEAKFKNKLQNKFYYSRHYLQQQQQH